MPDCIGVYLSILRDAVYHTRKLEAFWKIRIEANALYNTGVYDDVAFLFSVADNVWVCKLRNSTKFYTDVLSSALLKNIEERCKGLHAINSVDLPLIIQGYYPDALSMPVYINILEDAHRKLLSTNLPLYNATLLVMATKAVFVLQEYPDVSREWE